MFWKHGKSGNSATLDNPAKAKKLSPKDLITQELERIAPAQQVTYRLGQTYIKPYITVVRNAEYPGKGKKYSVLQDGMDAAGKPANKPGKFWDTNDAREIGGWIIDREGTQLQ
jgi:hypothetical protein